MGRDRHGRPRLDPVGAADEVEARASRPAVQAGDADPQRGSDARRRPSARVPDAEREAYIGIDVAQDAQ